MIAEILSNIISKELYDYFNHFINIGMFNFHY